MKVHVLFAPHVHCPFAHVPVQVVFASHVTWHGGASQRKSQWLPLPQVHVPFAHAALQLELLPSQCA